jgi:hypothetical protein
MNTIHDAVNPLLFNRVKTLLEGEQFPWYYVATTAYTSDDNQYDELYNGSFGHIAYRDGIKNSECSDLLEACLYSVLDKAGEKLAKLERIRIGYLPVSPVYTVNPPHIDMIAPHKVGLLYLNDSDGDTIIYNEKFDLSIGTMYNDHRDSIYYYEKRLQGKVTEMERSTPQANKFISFDGMHYHSSSTPLKTKRRIAINYVYKTHD